MLLCRLVNCSKQSNDDVTNRTCLEVVEFFYRRPKILVRLLTRYSVGIANDMMECGYSSTLSFRYTDLKTRQSSRSVLTEARVTLVELKEPDKSSLEISVEELTKACNI